MGNPLLHVPAVTYPRDAKRMHEELERDLHADCTVETCDMMSLFTDCLNELGHAHPLADCPKCTPAYAEPHPLG